LVSNPIHVLAVAVLRRALSSVSPGPGLADRFKRALTGQIVQQDAPVLSAAVKALELTGYVPADFDRGSGFNDLSDAVQKAIVTP
jgi:hypothetical protein